MPFFVSVNVISTKVLIEHTIFYVSYWRRDRHFTWSSEPREGLAACSTKVVPSFLSYFKTLSIGPAPGMEPATSRSAVTRPTDWANTIRFYSLDASYNSRRGVLRRWWYMELEGDVGVTKNAKQACLFGMTLDINRGERWMLQKWANGLTTFLSPKPQSKQKNNNNKKQVNKQTTKQNIKQDWKNEDSAVGTWCYIEIFFDTNKFHNK